MAVETLASGLQKLAVQFPPFIIAVIFHEYSHGFVARLWGDKTAEEAGRLTLNPVPHIDVLGTLIFPIINMVSSVPILIGWAKPVPIDPRRFRKYRPGLFWVSIAGPGSNVILAILSAATFCAITLWVPEDFYLREPLEAMAYISVTLNYALGIFNLIPLPPLERISRTRIVVASTSSTEACQINSRKTGSAACATGGIASHCVPTGNAAPRPKTQPIGHRP